MSVRYYGNHKSVRQTFERVCFIKQSASPESFFGIIASFFACSFLNKVNLNLLSTFILEDASFIHDKIHHRAKFLNASLVLYIVHFLRLVTL
jgi:hypothetical protein